MNLFKTRATDPTSIQKRSRSIARSLKPHIKSNKLNSLLFQGHLGNTPVVLDDKPFTYIKDGYMLNPDVYSVVNIRSRAAAAVPPLVLEVKNEKSANEYYRLKYSQRSGAGESFQKRQKDLRKKAFEEVPEDDDLKKLIKRPNPLQAWPEFFENLWGFMDITGNGFTHGVELTDGRFSEMWIMPPQLTRIKADKALEGLVRSYILEYYGQHHDIPAETVMHIKYWNPDYTVPGSHLYGMSPLRAAANLLRSGNDGLEALASSYRNMGAAGMAFPDDPDIDSLDQQQINALEKDLQRAVGPKFTKSILVTSAKMGWTNFGLSPVDLEILSALNLSLRKICNIYGVSSELLNDPENKTQANKKEARRGLYMDVVIPQMERIYAELNRWLVPRFEAANGKKYHIDYDVSAIEALGEDMERKVNWLSRAWWVTPEEKREAMDFEKTEDPMMGQVWAPAGMMPVSDLTIEEEIELRELRANYGLKDG